MRASSLVLSATRALGHLDDRCIGGFPDDGVLEIAATKVHGASTKAMPITAAAQHRGAFTGGFALARSYAHDLRGIDIHQARIYHYHCLALLVRKAAEAITAPATATAANLRILVVVSELGNTTDNNGIHPQDLSDLRGRVRIGAIAIGEILLAQNFAHGLALDYGVGAVLNEVPHQQVRDTPANVHIGTENRLRKVWTVA